jgi:hypothetical protein
MFTWQLSGLERNKSILHTHFTLVDMVWVELQLSGLERNKSILHTHFTLVDVVWVELPLKKIKFSTSIQLMPCTWR